MGFSCSVTVRICSCELWAALEGGDVVNRDVSKIPTRLVRLPVESCYKVQVLPVVLEYSTRLQVRSTTMYDTQLYSGQLYSDL
jgi:hypothetical protein